MHAYFLNVDLEIESKKDLNPIAIGMGEQVSILYNGPFPKPKRNFLSMELHGRKNDPDSKIHALCELVEKLPPTALRLWKTAKKRFNIGYELRPTEKVSCFTLRPDTLQCIAKLGAAIEVTYYRAEIEYPKISAKVTRSKSRKKS